MHIPFRRQLHELRLFVWAEFIIQQPKFATDVKFVETALHALCKSFGSLSVEERAVLVSVLAEKKCMPTEQGLLLPREAYLSSAKWIAGLPIVTFEKTGKRIPDDFLVGLGVRSVPSIETIFANINNLNWDTEKLVS